MDSLQKHVGRDARRGTPAGARSCKTRRWAAGVAVVIVTVVTVVILSFVLFGRAGPQVDQCPKEPEMRLAERLHQCQREQQDLNMMLHSVTQDARCSLCPTGWLWWRNHCYFFSFGLQENRQWNESAGFCQQHNSSLAVIRDSAEMDFIQGVMSKSSHFPFLWVGLTDRQQEGRWLWSDGTDVQQYMPVTVQWDADHRDCADLRGGGSLFAAECDAYGPWVCKKQS